MKYTQESHIITAKDVRAFFDHIVNELGINFHPDDDFKDYVNYNTHERTMDDAQAEFYNRLMDEAFDVCGDDVYRIGCDILFGKIEKLTGHATGD